MGPWQQKQYDRLTSNNNDSKQDWFVRAMVGAAMAENPAVMTASGWKQDKMVIGNKKELQNLISQQTIQLNYLGQVLHILEQPSLEKLQEKLLNMVEMYIIGINLPILAQHLLEKYLEFYKDIFRLKAVVLDIVQNQAFRTKMWI